MSLNMSDISYNPGSGYKSVTIRLYEFNFLDKKFHLTLDDETMSYVKAYVEDLENDVYGTKNELIRNYLLRKHSISKVDIIMDNPNIQNAFDIFKKMNEVDEILSEWVIPRKLKKERGDKLNSILGGN